VEFETLPDSQLIESFRMGRREAMGVLFARYRRLVLGVSFRILRDPTEAEDIAQDVFVDLCKRAELFEAERGSVRMWILQYAYSKSLKRRKRAALRGANEECFDEGSCARAYEPHRSPLGTDGLTAEQRAMMIAKALEGLSSEQREVIERAYYDGLSMKEIAQSSGETVGNIRHRYYRGLRKLRQILADPTHCKPCS
jgi:RNA polymerase sigma-70 factor (ECF subfamily)